MGRVIMTTSIEFENELATLIRARYILIAIETSEESRAIKLIQDAAHEKANARLVYEWSATLGMRDEDGKPIGHDGTKVAYDPASALLEIDKMPSEKAKSVYIIKDFHKFMDDKNFMIHRRLRDLATGLKWTSKTIIFISPTFKVPLDLQKEITVLNLPLPDADELKEMLQDAFEGLKLQENHLRNNIKDYYPPRWLDLLLGKDVDKRGDLKDQLVRVNKNRLNMEIQFLENGDLFVNAALGFTSDEFENIIAKCFVMGNLNIDLITNEKQRIKEYKKQHTDTDNEIIRGLLKDHDELLLLKASKKQNTGEQP